jgi:thioredoxin-related protein
MKKILSMLVLSAFLATAFSSFVFKAEELPLNATIPMPEHKMKDVSGKTISLSEVKTEKGLLVIFSCNTCPYVKLSESRILEYSQYCRNNNIGCILINSNEAQRSEEDSFEEMGKYYKNQKLVCPYVVDEKSILADAFGATRTPQCFLFDHKGLIYKGAIDDNIKDPGAVKTFYLKDALAALNSGQKPGLQQTKSIGCTIKRLE